MGPVERFTRDAASKFIWASLLLVAILGLVFAIFRGGDAVDAERRAAETRAVAAAERVLDPRVDDADLAAPIAGAQLATLRAEAQRSILNDPRVVRVRIWSSEGRLLFSTDRGDSLGSKAAFNDALLARAAADGPTTISNMTDIGGDDPEGRSLLRTYAPFQTSAIVEVDQTTAATIAPIRSEWLRYQILAGALVALFVALTFLSLRDPVERINTGVAFAPSAIPAGYALIDKERLHAVEEVYRLAHDRVARLEEKLAESEKARRRLEGDIQQALTKASTEAAKGRPTRPPVAPTSPATVVPPAAAPPSAPPSVERRPVERRRVERPAAAISSQPSANGEDRVKRPRRPRVAPRPTPGNPPEPGIVSVPESEVLGAPPAPASERPLARAVREDLSTAQPRSRPAGDEPKRAEVRRRQVPKREPDHAEAEPIVVERAGGPAQPKRASRRRRKTEPVAEAPAKRPIAQPAIDDAKAHEAALRTFIRLTESDRQHAAASEVDQGAVRAALARTAARKKPGGHRLQSSEGGREESPGGPPGR